MFPHVPEEEMGPREVRWDENPQNLPSLLYARKGPTSGVALRGGMGQEAQTGLGLSPSDPPGHTGRCGP